MPGPLSPIGALRLADPDKWAATVRDVMARTDGRIPEAAQELGISERQLFRWLDDPLLEGIERAPPCIQHGPRKPNGQGRRPARRSSP